MDRAFRKYFSQADLDRITAAVRSAEAATSGEIVPYVVLQSDAYFEAAWRAAAVTGGVILLLGILVFLFVDVWLPLTLFEFMAAALFAALGVFALVHAVPSLKRRLVGRRLMDHRVRMRAEEAFLSEEVFKTRERTGILIFVSLLEHRVVVLGDSGINAKVTPEHWNGIVAMVAEGMKTGKPADGLVRAIGRCGEILAEHGVRRRPDDTDELSDNLRMRKE